MVAVPLTLGRRVEGAPGSDVPAGDVDHEPGAPLVDRYGRVHRDLRVSLTDRCSLRCTYCMPEQGNVWLPKPSLLTAEELVRVVGVAAEAGIRTIRLTGGEPLLRRVLPALIEAGLTRLNISLDTLRADRFRELTRRDRLHDVLDGIAAARDSGLRPLKLNAVAMRGVNDDELVELVEFALAHDAQLRFIEQMPLDAGHTWRRDAMVTREEILAALAARWALTPVAGRGGAPAERWRLDDGPHEVGVIASVTAPFCGDCDRLRLTADGQLRNCLFATSEMDLLPTLRGAEEAAIDAGVERLLRACVRNKLPGHAIDDPAFLQPVRPMNAIGG